MHGLDGKVAIVTGGAGEIGRQICQRLLEEGCKVAVLDMDERRAEQAAAELDGETVTAVADITDAAAVRTAVSSVRAKHDRIDILVNNAGWDKGAPFLQTDPELWKKIIAINYQGPLNMHHAVLPIMAEQGHGKVVNVASDAARVGSSGEAVYAGCKAAIIAFGKSVARELAKKGVCINTVCPGPTDPAFFREFAGEGEFAEKLKAGLRRAVPMRRLGEPADVAGIVTFLASEEANFITGQVISVSGGLTMHG